MNVAQAKEKIQDFYTRTIGSIIPTSWDSKRERELLIQRLVGVHLDADFSRGEYWNQRLKPRLLELCEKHTAELRSLAKDPYQNDTKILGASHRFEAVQEIIAMVEGAELERQELQSRISTIEEITREAVQSTEPIFADLE